MSAEERRDLYTKLMIAAAAGLVPLFIALIINALWDLQNTSEKHLDRIIRLETQYEAHGEIHRLEREKRERLDRERALYSP